MSIDCNSFTNMSIDSFTNVSIDTDIHVGKIVMGPFEKRDVATIIFAGNCFNLDWDLENNRSLLHHIDRYAFSFPAHMTIRQIIDWFFINYTVDNHSNLDILVSDAQSCVFKIENKN